LTAAFNFSGASHVNFFRAKGREKMSQYHQYQNPPQSQFHDSYQGNNNAYYGNGNNNYYYDNNPSSSSYYPEYQTSQQSYQQTQHPPQQHPQQHQQQYQQQYQQNGYANDNSQNYYDYLQQQFQQQNATAASWEAQTDDEYIHPEIENDPDTIVFDEFNPLAMSRDATVVVLGPRRRGKSVLVAYLMYLLKFERGAAFCGLQPTALFYEQFIPPLFVHEGE
jgi:hypothetical protein